MAAMHVSNGSDTVCGPAYLDDGEAFRRLDAEVV